MFSWEKFLKNSSLNDSDEFYGTSSKRDLYHYPPLTLGLGIVKNLTI